MSKKIPDRFLIDQFQDNPEIRKLMLKAQNPEEMMKIFESRNISFSVPDEDEVFEYVKDILNDPEVQNHPDDRLHI